MPVHQPETAAPTESEVQHAVSVIRQAVRYANPQPGGLHGNVKNEREIIAALVEAGWRSPSRISAAKNASWLEGFEEASQPAEMNFPPAAAPTPTAAEPKRARYEIYAEGSCRAYAVTAESETEALQKVCTSQRISEQNAKNLKVRLVSRAS